MTATIIPDPAGERPRHRGRTDGILLRLRVLHGRVRRAHRLPGVDPIKIRNSPRPVGLIVDAVLREVYSGGMSATPEVGLGDPYDLPENLRRFFQGKQQSTPPQVNLEGQDVQQDCCAPAQAQTCCAPSEKASCCGSSASGSCGCQ